MLYLSFKNKNYGTGTLNTVLLILAKSTDFSNMLFFGIEKCHAHIYKHDKHKNITFYVKSILSLWHIYSPSICRSSKIQFIQIYFLRVTNIKCNNSFNTIHLNGCNFFKVPQLYFLILSIIQDIEPHNNYFTHFPVPSSVCCSRIAIDRNFNTSHFCSIILTCTHIWSFSYELEWHTVNRLSRTSSWMTWNERMYPCYQDLITGQKSSLMIWNFVSEITPLWGPIEMTQRQLWLIRTRLYNWWSEITEQLYLINYRLCKRSIYTKKVR